MDEAIGLDWLVVGGGIAGASVAWFLAPHGRVAVLEAESQPGYHSTGRSAALFLETYGPPQVRALSRASRAFLAAPPAGFAEQPILAPRGSLMVGDPARPGEVERVAAELGAVATDAPAARSDASTARRGTTVHRVTAAWALARVPVLRPETTGDCVLEPDAMDIDVHALHQGFLRGARAHGALLHAGARVRVIERAADGGWRVEAGGRRYRAGVVVNAAGAWADELAQAAGVRPIGLVPKRRSAFTFAPPAGLPVRDWPALIGIDESWYVKPDAGVLLGSPANADPVVPHDVQAEELDVAIAIDRIERATTLAIRRPIRTWAGLRSFVSDGELVGGPAPEAPDFVWVAAQGGYGIQTCAAMGEACAAMARGLPIPQRLQDAGIRAEALSPGRAALAG